MTASWIAPLTVEQLAKMLRCSEFTVRERARKGDLPGLKFGDDWVFPVEAVAHQLTEMALDDAKERRTTPAPSAAAFGAPRKQRKPLPLSLQRIEVLNS